jgi:hypothetical protein
MLRLTRVRPLEAFRRAKLTAPPSPHLTGSAT